MSERAFAWRGLALAGRAAAVLGGLLTAAIGSPAEAQILGTACASPSATVAASATILGNATPRLTTLCTGGTWQLLPHQVSNTTLPCESATTGLLRYSGGLQVCTGSSWTALGGAGTLGLDDLSDVTSSVGLQSIYAGAESGGTGTASANQALALGYRAQRNNALGNYNVALGPLASSGNRNGSSNVTVGGSAFFNPEGSHNIALGNRAGYGATNSVVTGSVILGYSAGEALTSSTGNVLVGFQAGNNMTSGDYNIVIGYNTDPFSNTGSNQLNIGNTIYGDLGNKRIGVNVTSPTVTLDVSGRANIGTNTFLVGVINFSSNLADNSPTVYINSGGDGAGEHALHAYARATSFAADVIRASTNRTSNSAYNLINTIIDDAGTPIYPFVVRGDGNVGIGTSAPSVTLHVAGALLAGEFYRGAYWDGSNWRTGSSGGPGFIVRTAGGNITELRVAPTGTPGALTGTSPAIGFDGASGRVGIATGTQVPSGTLHISGTVYMTRNTAAPATCNSSVNGLLALTSAAKMCVCDGTTWKDVGSNYGACSW